ncbi:phage tail protein [Desulfobulbus rhabdoformis]|uniref:phage baseplate assembly protein V n=1 Tax=Desulfobulbus rhabdoformis TaxID=34032 RepID=UPI0019657D93|nr:phage baseplate assembly protein V [Desulfobulbus rhabdoformis]MBM9613170.1 phage tail protein [Desulfobulbus rhabdoformis]
MPDDVIGQHLSQMLRERRAYGKYRGFVVDNDDPQRLARVRVQVPSLLGEAETDWALPCLPCGGLENQGFFTVPDIGTQVWVEFEGGNLDYPIWTGTFWQQEADIPEEVKEDQTTTKLWRTPGGHVLLLEDCGGEETVRLEHSGGAKLEMDAEGNLELANNDSEKLVLSAQEQSLNLEDRHGNRLILDSTGVTLEDMNGNRFSLRTSGITIETGGTISLNGTLVELGGSGGEPIIKGQSLLTLLATHVHPTGVGPSGPPVPQGEMSTLSLKVTSA